MSRRRIAAVSVLGIALVAGSLIVASSSALATSSTRSTSCSIPDDNHWPSYVQGRPAGIDPHTTSSIYMWHDSGGWHIRVTHHGSNLRTFAGQLNTGGAFVNAHAVGLEKSDQFSISSDRHAITFLFKNYGSIDGVDFHTSCAPSIQFSYQSDGGESPTAKIVIGKGASHPPTDPFQIDRVPVVTTTTSACQATTDDPWPSWTQGRPAGIDPHTTSSIYMWHDDGWHIRVTHKGSNLRTFSGQLTTTGKFVNSHAVQLEKSDVFQVSGDKHGITFLFKNYGLIDGVDFHTTCAPSIKFSFQSDGGESPTAKIVIGKNGVHPPTDPFEIARNSTGPTPAS